MKVFCLGGVLLSNLWMMATLAMWELVVAEAASGWQSGRGMPRLSQLFGGPILVLGSSLSCGSLLDDL